MAEIPPGERLNRSRLLRACFFWIEPRPFHMDTAKPGRPLRLLLVCAFSGQTKDFFQLRRRSAHTRGTVLRHPLPGLKTLKLLPSGGIGIAEIVAHGAMGMDICEAWQKQKARGIQNFFPVFGRQLTPGRKFGYTSTLYTQIPLMKVMVGKDVGISDEQVLALNHDGAILVPLEGAIADPAVAAALHKGVDQKTVFAEATAIRRKFA